MIWNDCHSDGMSDHHWHSAVIDIDMHEEEGEARTVRAMMLDYYKNQFVHLGVNVWSDAYDMTIEAMKDYGLVGIFKDVPETI